MDKKEVEKHIHNMALPQAEELGFELIETAIVKEDGEWYLRLFIDKPDESISSDDCAALSRKISGMLDEVEGSAEDPMKSFSSYYLEVSSPGMERLLSKPEHYERFKEHAVKVKTSIKVNGKNKVKGILKNYNDEALTLEMEGKDIQLKFEDIEEIRLYEPL